MIKFTYIFIKKNSECNIAFGVLLYKDSQFLQISINETISHSRSPDGEAGPYFSGTYGMQP